MYSNLDSMPNKRDEILSKIDDIKPSIICFTETLPKNLRYPNEADYVLPGYERFSNKEHKHGVAIYFHPSLKARECHAFKSYEFSESLWCSFKSKEGKSILVGGMYRPPRSYKEGKQNEDEMFKLLKDNNMKKYDTVLVMGDFNFPSLNFEGIFTGDRDAERIENFRDAFLTQKVNFPTRRRPGQRLTRDDLIFVNDEHIISDVNHLAPFGKSDHDCLIFQLYVSLKKVTENENYRFNMSKGDYNKMRKMTQSMDWSIESHNVEVSWLKIKNNIHSLMERCIPKKKNRKKVKTQPSWMCAKTLRKIKKKHRMFKRFLMTRNGKLYLKFIQARNECNRQIRKAKKAYERKVANNSKTNVKQFWKYVHEKTKVKQGVGVLKKNDNTFAESDNEKAETLNSFFASVFTREQCHNLPNFAEGEKSNGILLSDIRVTPKAVRNKLKDLNPNKAQGPDLIPSKVLKELNSELAEPLCNLFNLSLEKGIIPADWREGEITAIFKKGSRLEPGNYRPVSLTCITCKILESLVRDQIVNFFNDNNLYSNCQFGFRQKRSCASQLLCVMEDFSKYMDERQAFDVFYLDFSKAFDSVPHLRLLEKLKAYGITGKVHNWVKAFLTDRVQRVKVGNAVSSNENVLSGIPQGVNSWSYSIYHIY